MYSRVNICYMCDGYNLSYMTLFTLSIQNQNDNNIKLDTLIVE